MDIKQFDYNSIQRKKWWNRFSRLYYGVFEEKETTQFSIVHMHNKDDERDQSC